MDLYTSTDCFDSLSKGSPYVSQEECDKMFQRENAFPCDTGTHWTPPIGNICPRCIQAPCNCGSCVPDQPLGENLTEAEQICQDKISEMSFPDAQATNEFYDNCVEEQNQLLYPEGEIEIVEIEPLTAGVGKDNMLLWLVVAGAALWYLNTKGFFKKL